MTTPLPPAGRFWAYIDNMTLRGFFKLLAAVGLGTTLLTQGALSFASEAPAPTQPLMISEAFVQQMNERFEALSSRTTPCKDDGTSDGFDQLWNQYVVPYTAGYLHQRGCGRLTDRHDRNHRRAVFDKLDSALRIVALAKAEAAEVQAALPDFGARFVDINGVSKAASPDFKSRYSASAPVPTGLIVRMIPIVRIKPPPASSMPLVTVDGKPLTPDAYNSSEAADDLADADEAAAQEDHNLSQLTKQLARRTKF